MRSEYSLKNNPHAPQEGPARGTTHSPVTACLQEAEEGPLARPSSASTSSRDSELRVHQFVPLVALPGEALAFADWLRSKSNLSP